MGFSKLALANLRRTPFRAGLTATAVAITVVAFLLLRSVSAGFTRRVEQTPVSRVVTRNKISWSQPMPVRYAEEIAQLPGVRYAMGGRWAEFKHPKSSAGFGCSAVQAAPFIAMHYELVSPPEQRRAFVDQRDGIFVSEDLAREWGWRLGQLVHLTDVQSRRDWQFTVSGIFKSTRYGFGDHSIWIHWEYYNESLPREERDKISVVSAEIFDPKQGGRIAKAVDMHFDERHEQTFSQQDQALHASLLGMQGALLEALDILSLFVLFIIVLIVGNTVAMGVRERTGEYGVLRAIGFRPAHLGALVLGEAAALSLLGGALGLVLSYPLVEFPLSRLMHERIGVPPLDVPFESAVAALAASVLLGLFAAGFPARSAARLEVVESLRHVG
jgi:putative ABC transport system permease protein